MTPGDGVPIEVELKFRMTDAATGERLIAGDELGGFTALGAAETTKVEDRYVDTPEGALATAGYAGRLRTSERGTVITLKGLRRIDDGGVVHRREELEGTAVEGEPAASWPESDARDAVVRLAGDQPLAEIARIHQSRHKRLYGRDGAVVEVSVDDVSVLAGGEVVERFAELELELREGEEAALDPLVDLLNEIEELVPAQTSKLERALAAVHHEDGAEAAAPVVAVAPAPVAAVSAPATSPAVPERPGPRIVVGNVGKTPGVVADDHLAEAGRKVLRFHLARMLAREAGTREGREAEELHAMRVATRRQRAAWRVFGESFDPARTKRHRQRLREVAADLGAVRDLDVLAEALEAYRAKLSAKESAALEPRIASWRH